MIVCLLSPFYLFMIVLDGHEGLLVLVIVGVYWLLNFGFQVQGVLIFRILGQTC